jgi:hypothetical protein
MEVPDLQAPPIFHYPQFAETNIPTGSGAVRAYRGFIRPFSDDQTARRVLRAIIAGQPLSVASGRLDSEAKHLPPLAWVEALLIDMPIPCTVVVLEFAGNEHPRAYLIDPPMVDRLSMSTHVRKDKTLIIEGQKLPALCIYSGNLFKYDDSAERLPQFLNQLSTYLAKHLIFLRTRCLSRIGKDGTIRPVSNRTRGESIKASTLRISKKYIWYGRWFGPSAPMQARLHLRTVDPNGECWCNSGEVYKNCHRQRELAENEPRFSIATMVRGVSSS